MININLLPQDIGRKASKGPSAGPSSGAMAVTGILVLIYAVIIGMGVFFLSSSQAVASERDRLENLRDDLEAEVAETEELYADLKEELEVLENQVVILQVLDPEDRLFWAEKLNLLPQVIPDGVFLTNIQVNENVVQRETQASKEAYDNWKKIPKKDRPKSPPRKQFYPEITYTVQFDGISYVEDGTDEQRLQKIIDFYTQLQSKELTVPFSGEKAFFMDKMNPNIDFPFVEKTDLQNREVAKFTFNLKSKPFLPEGDGNKNNKNNNNGNRNNQS